MYSKTNKDHNTCLKRGEEVKEENKSRRSCPFRKGSSGRSVFEKVFGKGVDKSCDKTFRWRRTGRTEPMVRVNYIRIFI